MSKSVRHGLVFVVLAALLLTTALTGCQAPSAPAATPTAAAPAATQPTGSSSEAQPTATVAQEPAAEQITILMAQEPDTLMPFIGQMTAKEEVLNTLWTDLVKRNEKNEYVAFGAESVPTVENGGAKFVGEGEDKHLEVTYKIKKGLKWHDGTPVTSHDIKFTLDLVKNPDFPVEQRDLVLKVYDVETPDDQTAIVKFMSEKQAREAAQTGGKYGTPEFYAGYANQSGPVVDPLYFMVGDGNENHILPKHILGNIDPKDLASSDYARNPVGTGPYKLVEWIPGERLVVEAVDTSLWGTPAIKTVIFRLVADANAILNALSAGEGQVVIQVGLDVDQSPELDKMESEGKIKAYYQPSTGWEHIDINLQKDIFKDKRVRQAMMYALDRQVIVDKLMYGKTQVLHTWITPPSWALDDASIVKYEYNPEKAKQLLAEAGWKMGSDGILEKDGVKFKIKLQTTTQAIRQAIAPLVQANWKAVGIDVEPEFLPGRGLFESNGPLQTHTFDTAIYTWISDPDPDPTSLFLGKNCPDGANYPCYQDAEFDALVMQQSSMLSQADRKPIFQKLTKKWTEDLPTLPLFQRLNVTAAVPQLKNFKPTPTSTPETWNIHEWFLPAN